MKRIILTAFDRFGNYSANTTELVAKRLDTAVLSGFLIDSVIFPCEIPKENRGEMLMKRARETRSSGIICLGMSSEKKGLCIETRTRNAIMSEKYCPPEINGKPIDPERPYNHPFLLDLAPWELKKFCSECFEKDIPVSNFSIEPGGWCCNHLMYELRMVQIRDLKEKTLEKVPFIFFHTPCSPEAIKGHEEMFKNSGKATMTLTQIEEGLEVLLANATLPTF